MLGSSIGLFNPVDIFATCRVDVLISKFTALILGVRVEDGSQVTFCKVEVILDL